MPRAEDVFKDKSSIGRRKSCVKSPRLGVESGKVERVRERGEREREGKEKGNRRDFALLVKMYRMK